VLFTPALGAVLMSASTVIVAHQRATAETEEVTGRLKKKES
jgi:hypothetical protein